jgi:hypothetical protein
MFHFVRLIVTTARLTDLANFYLGGQAGGKMNHRERMALDEHIAGGHYSKDEVELVCMGNNCGWEGWGVVHTEYGYSEIEPEECPDCKGSVEVVE